jgi:hypothetical protein
MSNQATVAGVDAVNKARQTEVLNKAQSLINGILGNNRTIKDCQVRIVEQQKCLAEIADDVVTQAGVLGADFSAPLNPNQQTIVEAIKKVNDARQATVALNGQHHTNEVLRLQGAIKVANKSNEDLRKQLSELSADVVTVGTVTSA